MECSSRLSRSAETVTDNPLHAAPALAMSIPLFIRLLEWAREDAPNDVALHRAAEKAQGIKGECLDMDDYRQIVGR